jgi:hypothetical protein
VSCVCEKGPRPPSIEYIENEHIGKLIHYMNGAEEQWFLPLAIDALGEERVWYVWSNVEAGWSSTVVRRTSFDSCHLYTES